MPQPTPLLEALHGLVKYCTVIQGGGLSSLSAHGQLEIKGCLRAPPAVFAHALWLLYIKACAGARPCCSCARLLFMRTPAVHAHALWFLYTPKRFDLLIPYCSCAGRHCGWRMAHHGSDSLRRGGAFTTLCCTHFLSTLKPTPQNPIPYHGRLRVHLGGSCVYGACGRLTRLWCTPVRLQACVWVWHSGRVCALSLWFGLVWLWMSTWTWGLGQDGGDAPGVP